ncbi:MAG: hypothetical protein LBN95_06275 [Prevotellaceae bacterium]|jgi:HTH-type transcriptional regulator/antitoxin HigA|nr:hypothetical protein [Prevotellaceae bacterium]
MTQIKTKAQYETIIKRIETLMDIVTEETPTTTPEFIELDFLADLVVEYEEEFFPIGKLTYEEKEKEKEKYKHKDDLVFA